MSEPLTGDPLVLTWREMAVLGWTSGEAMDHKGSTNLETARTALKVERRRLKEQGWHFPRGPKGQILGAPTPPPPLRDTVHGAGQSYAVEAQEVADKLAEIMRREIDSNWGARLRAK